MQEGGGTARSAKDILDERTLTVREADPLDRAQRLLRLNNLEEILVLTDDAKPRVAGILTVADIVLAYQRGLTEPQPPEPAFPSAPSAPRP